MRFGFTSLQTELQSMDTMESSIFCKEILENSRKILDKLDKLSEDMKALKPGNDTSDNTVLDYLDVCQILHISVRYLRILHNQKKLTGFKIGRRRFYLSSDVQRYLQEVREKQNL
jgi:hypothetical protein